MAKITPEQIKQGQMMAMAEQAANEKAALAARANYDLSTGMFPGGADPFADRTNLPYQDVPANYEPNIARGVSAGSSSTGGQSPGASPSELTDIIDAKAAKRKAAAPWSNMALEQQRQSEVMQNVSIAGQNGGYEGALAYLKANDPEAAMKLEKSKLQLDAQMMKNEVLATAAETDKAKAMLEGYQVLAQTGMMINGTADPNDAALLYKQVLPVIRTVNPDAPSTLNAEASDMLLLATAQAMPQNQKFKLGVQASQAQSAIGKLQADIDARVARGESQENSEGLRNLLGQMNYLSNKAVKSDWEIKKIGYEEKLMKAQSSNEDLKKQKTMESLVKSINSDYRTDSKAFIQAQQNMLVIQSALNEIKRNPTNGAAYNQLKYGYARMLNGSGVLSNTDLEMASSSTGAIAQAIKKVRNWGWGSSISLNSQEVKHIEEQVSTYMSRLQETQSKINNHYQSRLDQYGIDRKEVNLLNAAPPKAIDYLMQNDTPENREYFKNHWGFVPDFPER